MVLVTLVWSTGCSSEGSVEEIREITGSDRSGTVRVESTEERAEDRTEEGALLVPVAHLTSPLESTSLEELSRTEGLAVSEEAGGAVEELLGGADLAPFDSPSAVLEHVSRTPEAVGLVPWGELEPRVKALAVDGELLLAAGGSSPEEYPLRFGEAEGPDPGELRRVVVGGDIVLDRGQSYAVIQQDRGLDFPTDGGYAAITGRALEPNPYDESRLVYQFTAERRGEAGAVREYLRGADLALANFENPVIEDAVWHPEDPTFTGDLRLLPILGRIGIDGVTLANNHILDAGTPGLYETLGHLDEAGISYAGAGEDLDASREPMVFDLGGLTVGVLSYQNVPSYEWAWATETSPGTAPLTEDVVREDVEELEGRVDLVVVMPHWGIEYLAEPEPGQIELAHAAVDAGADLIVGDHAHWPKGVEVYGGSPVFYGTGNFLFDQSWSEETSTGIFAEVLLYEDRIVQARPVPFIVLDNAQPNFLVPEAGGERALQTIFAASVGPEFDAYNDNEGS